MLDTVPTGRVLIDGTRTGSVDDEMLRDRRHLAADGLVVPVVVVNRQTGRREGVPELVARGFVPEAEAGDVLEDGATFIAAVIDGCSAERAHRRRTAQGTDPRRAAPLPEETHRPAADGAARGDGDLGERGEACVTRGAVGGLRVPRVAARQRVRRRGPVRASLIWLIALASYDPNDTAVVLRHRLERRARPISSAGSARSWPSCRSRCRLRLLPAAGAGRDGGLAVLLVPAGGRALHQGHRPGADLRLRQRDAQPARRARRPRARAPTRPAASSARCWPRGSPRT